MALYEVAPKVRYYVNDVIAKTLDKKRHLVSKKDRDFFFMIDGEEGSGKSYLAFQCARYLDPSFNMTRVCMTAREFLKAVQTANKAEAIVYDEAYTGMSARRSMSEINNMLTETVFECRKKNLFVFIVLPSIFFLDRTIVLHRGKVLFHTYFKKEKRGFYSIYTKNQIKTLVFLGRKTLNYNVTSPRMRARFYGSFALDCNGSNELEEAYSKKKLDSIREKSIGRENKNIEKNVHQRNYLMWRIVKKPYTSPVTKEQLLKEFDLIGSPLGDRRYYEIIEESNKYTALDL